MNAQNISQMRAAAQSSQGPTIVPKAGRVTVSLSVIEAAPGCVSPGKTFGCDHSGAPIVVQAGRQPASGTVRKISFAGTPTEIVERLAATLDALSGSQAIICAPPPDGQEVWPFVTKTLQPVTPGAIARTDDFLREVKGPALFGLDFDAKGWPEALRSNVRRAPRNVTGVLEQVAPCFKGAAVLYRASSSAGVRNAATGQVANGKSQHRFFIVSNGSGRGRFSRILHERLVLAGFGYGFVTKAGTTDIRSLIDRSASESASRLWFEGAAILSDPRLEFVPGGRRSSIIDGDMLDMDALVDLTSDERAQLERIECEIRKQCESEALVRRSEWLAERKAALVAKGLSPERAEKSLRLAVETRELTDDYLVEFDDEPPATVLEILADRKRFHRLTGPDPLEPEYGGGRNKAILFTDGQAPRVESQAHGGIRYFLRRSHEATAALYWEEPPGPADIFGHADPAELGELPAGCLPPWLTAWAQSEARRKGVPEAFAVASAVTVLAAAVGASLRVQVRQKDDGWTEPAALWTCLVADPGNAKSPTLSVAADPLEKLNSDLIKEWRPKHEVWRKAEAAAKRRKGGEAGALEIGPEPRCGRRTADNFTSEKLVRILAQNPRGVLCAPDELTGLLGQIGAYKRSGDGDRGQMLGLFDAKPITVDRVSSETVAADSALISILAGSQPDKISELAKNLSGDGMLQRFIFVMHDRRHHRGVDEAPDAEAQTTYRRVVRGLASAEYVLPEAIKMEPAAAAALADATERIAQLQYGVGASPALQGHLSKWGKILPRLALTLHAAIEFERKGQVDPEERIPIATVAMAINLGRFFVRHSLAFYEKFFSAPDQASAARWIGEFLLTRSDLREVSRRDLYDARKDFRAEGLPKLFAAAGELENAGWLEVAERRADGPSRWRVNPQIHERFAEHAARATRERTERRERIEESARIRGWIGGDDERANDVEPRRLSLFD